MDYAEAKKYLQKLRQEQLLEYFHELTKEEQTALLNDVQNIDFNVISNIPSGEPKTLGKITPIAAVGLQEISLRRPLYEAEGLKALARGRVGGVLLAGGQGTRLGFNKPKGMFNIGERGTLTIFERQMHSAACAASKAGKYFPLFIMTAPANHGETVAFFAQNNYFGYPREAIHFFVQSVAPSCSFEGKVYLDEKHRVSFTPNGNGGWYSSLVKSGLNQVLERENVEWLNVFGVDNVLQQICDPVFIGATILKNCGCGAKVVKKVCPEERVGVLCNENGKPTIIEYYEMPEDLKNQRQNGELVYPYGVILNYLFSVRALNETLSKKLPYHAAKKAIAHIEGGKRVIPLKPCGYKFETLVVDMVKMMGSCLAFEVDREKEFAPVKNSTGADSVESARALLKKNGIHI